LLYLQLSTNTFHRQPRPSNIEAPTDEIFKGVKGQGVHPSAPHEQDTTHI
jgi:hypothetical protein